MSLRLDSSSEYLRGFEDAVEYFTILSDSDPDPDSLSQQLKVTLGSLKELKTMKIQNFIESAGLGGSYLE